MQNDHAAARSRTRTMIFWLLAILAAVALTGCATSSGASESPSPSRSPSLRESLQPASIQPSRIPDVGGADEITGILGADSVEGGCAYLESADRIRYQVIYPEGWRVSAAPLELRNPAGDVVATGGDTVTVRGSEAGDMASICQVGPMFRASEVVSIDR